MIHDTNSSDICTLFFKCVAYFDTINREIKHQFDNVKQSLHSEVDIWNCYQAFYQWGVGYGANLDPSSTISLDYKFRAQDYTQSMVQSQLGHLLEDLEGVQKLCRGESTQGEFKVVFGKIESVVAELSRFMGHLPKELWLDLKQSELQ
ncbi:hypothetical protein ACHAPU_009035 [Fusarium lateritium]